MKLIMENWRRYINIKEATDRDDPPWGAGGQPASGGDPMERAKELSASAQASQSGAQDKEQTVVDLVRKLFIATFDQWDADAGIGDDDTEADVHVIQARAALETFLRENPELLQFARNLITQNKESFGSFAGAGQDRTADMEAHVSQANKDALAQAQEPTPEETERRNRDQFVGTQYDDQPVTTAGHTDSQIQAAKDRQERVRARADRRRARLNRV